MSAEQLEALVAAARDDTQLAERLTAATTTEEMLAVAADAGFTITTDDLHHMAVAHARGELNEQELEAVAGGQPPSDQHQPWWLHDDN